MNCFDVVYLGGGIELDQNDSIFTGKWRMDPWPTNNFLLQSGISSSIKILSSCFLYGCLWLLRRGEIAVIQMLRDFNIPVDITKERTIPSSTVQWREKKKRLTSVLNIPSPPPLQYLITSHYLCRKQTVWHIQNAVARQSSLGLNHVHEYVPAAPWETRRCYRVSRFSVLCFGHYEGRTSSWLGMN